MNWTAELDLYCERLGPGLGAEPWNALSNLGFAVAAIVIAVRFHRAGWDLRLLAGLVGLVAVGSATFHTVAQLWAAWMDLIAIAVFIWVYLQRLLVRGAGLSNGRAIAAVIVYAVISRLVETAAPPGTWNGSIAYLPAATTLIVVTVWIAIRRRTALAPFAAAAGLFAVSLTLRTADAALCTAWPLGTHWLWHLLNALVLYLLVAGLVRVSAATTAPGARL